MIERQTVIGEVDMLQTTQQDALYLARKALDEFDATSSIQIAHFIKKCGCFIYFGIGNLAILLFRGGVAPKLDKAGY